MDCDETETYIMILNTMFLAGGRWGHRPSRGKVSLAFNIASGQIIAKLIQYTWLPQLTVDIILMHTKFSTLCLGHVYLEGNNMVID